ncbi:hypothetical protein [Actinomadura coerulea]|uniref:hypothetical protein n=1 Tax=Actinomadura coerulea TaxID=46159 RepID=UPI003415527A
MSYLDPVLELPPVFGDKAVEIEAEIMSLAYEFFGAGTELALPREYHAKLTVGGRWSKIKELYVVEGLSVRRPWPSACQNTLSRIVDLPVVLGGNVLEVQAGIERVANEFFGSDDNIKSSTVTEYQVQIAKGVPDCKKYKVEGVTLTQTAKWPEA